MVRNDTPAKTYGQVACQGRKESECSMLKYVYSIDFGSFVFSSVGNALLFLSWTLIIIPAILWVTHNYKPKDFLGYISAVTFWCICVLLLILSPISLLLYFIYRWLYKTLKTRKVSNKAMKPKVADASSVPASPAHQPAVPTTQSIGLAQDASPSYRVCHFLWTRSIIFCEHIQKNPPLTCQTYILTAFFYSITKHMRSQDLVDEIYSQLIPATEPFTSKIENKTRSFDCIQSAYRRFRSVLNESGIDPRNECGIAELWAITSQWAFPNIALTENEEKAFMYNTFLVTNRALEIYKLKPTETIYYMEAANGMTVRVPESKLETWQEEQDNLRKGIGTELTEAEEKLRDRILRDIYGPRE